MLAAFVSPASSAAVAPKARLSQPCGQPRRAPDAGFFAAGAPILALGAGAVLQGRRGERRARVAAAAGWKPDPQRIGATLPLANPQDGVLMWDPVGFCRDGKQETFDKYREAEIKHGRVAMLAVVGLVVQHYVHIPNFVTPEGLIPMGDMPSGLGALNQEPGGQAFGLLVLAAGLVETGILRAPEGAKPWEFGDPAGWRKEISYLDMDDDTLKTYEIEHGRLAMLGFMGAITAEYVTGYDAVQQWENWAEGIRNFNAAMY